MTAGDRPLSASCRFGRTRLPVRQGLRRAVAVRSAGSRGQIVFEDPDAEPDGFPVADFAAEGFGGAAQIVELPLYFRRGDSVAGVARIFAVRAIHPTSPPAGLDIAKCVPDVGSR